MERAVDEPVTWYFDFVSPFAYLQWHRLQRLGLAVTPKPILFAGLLDRLGQKGPAEIPGKREFTYRHVLWRAARDGIPMRLPPAHPFNPMPALRLCVAAGATVQAVDTVFRHLWGEGGSIDGAEAQQALASKLDLSSATDALADPNVKARLLANFDEALQAGVFGVPTLACEGELFWGDDATEMFLDFRRDPGAFRRGEMARIADLPVGAARRAP
jgi:2-hydroxychromene-2-carboxylate isomerase